MEHTSTPFLIYIIASASAVLGYVYLYIQCQERYIGIWACAWGLYLAKAVCIEQFFLQFEPCGEVFWRESILSRFADRQSFAGQVLYEQAIRHLFVTETILYAALTVFFSVLVTWGTCIFVEKQLSRKWVALSVVSIAICALGLLSGWHRLVYGIIFQGFVSYMLLWNGIAFTQKATMRGVGKYIIGAAFLIMGINSALLTLLLPYHWFTPWGYVIDAALRFINILGAFVMYFEFTKQALQDKEMNFRLITEHAEDIVYRYRIAKPRGFEYISPAIFSVTGYSPEEFYSDPYLIFRIIHPLDRPLGKRFKDVRISKTIIIAFRLLCKDGKEIWTEQKAIPIRDERGRLVAIEGVCRDITESKKLEQDILRLDRLNTVGEMAAKVAHEIRNPMTTVRGYLQFLGGKQELQKYKEQIGLLLDELDRTNSLIREYLSLSQNRTHVLKAIQLNNVLETLYPLIQADANATSKYVTLRLGSVPLLSMDEKEMRQLILNLTRNGLEAMQAGGTLTLQTFMDNGEVVLAIRDQGKGIPEEILANLGEPFLTTKETGTGLGLPVCYRIAQKHRAIIKVETSSKGTTFFVRFNIAKKRNVKKANKQKPKGV